MKINITQHRRGRERHDRTKTSRVITVFIVLLNSIVALNSLNALAELRVTDSQQRTVVLAKPATRIIALAPHIVESVYSAGAGDKLVGVVSYSNYPEQAKAITRVGDYQSWSLEAIVALQPDLIIMWGSGGGRNSPSSLTTLGIPVYVSEPRQLNDIPQFIRDIGTLTGTEQVSEKEAGRIEQEFKQLADHYSSQKALSIFYQVWNTPLQTLNGEHLISQVMKLCGAYNVFSDATSLAPKISLEAVLSRNPDLIVASGMGAEKPEWLDEWKRYPSLKAVQNKALFFINPDHIQRPTARIVLGARTLCKQLATQR